jgi:hypothetical protein
VLGVLEGLPPLLPDLVDPLQAPDAGEDRGPEDLAVRPGEPDLEREALQLGPVPPDELDAELPLDQLVGLRALEVAGVLGPGVNERPGTVLEEAGLNRAPAALADEPPRPGVGREPPAGLGDELSPLVDAPPEVEEVELAGGVAGAEDGGDHGHSPREKVNT